MSQGPSQPNPNVVRMGIDNSAMYYGMESIDAFGTNIAHSEMENGGADTSMTGMLRNNMMGGFDGLAMTVSGGLLPESGLETRSYTPINSNATQQQQRNGLSEEMLIGHQSPIDTHMNGVGAGPLPSGFGAQSILGGGSTLTEFTKRRNWSQRVMEELKDFLYILTPDGRIVYISPSGKQLTGYAQDELVGKFIVDFIHPDDSGIFVREFNESIASGNPLRFFYRFRKHDGHFTIFESHGHPHLASEASQYGPNNSASFCRGFFMMARPYPAKNAALLDSFLEHKMENERLTRRIADLKREEAEEAEDAHWHWQKKLDGRSDATPSEATETIASSSNNTPKPVNTNPDVLAMPPPAKPPPINTALTRQNLEDANASSRPDSMNDKMARYEGATHIETVEMLTGLRYQDGERSHGISTGDHSPALIRGDAGIAIPFDKDSRAGDKKKKLKVADEYVCTDCGTLDSPEWRKGPSGPKTLCNACGLRWAKKEKKRGSNGLVHGPPTLQQRMSTGSG